jgi:methylamine---glutamate N-methyltransferase subunit C
LAGTSYVPGVTEQEALSEIKGLLEKHVANEGMEGGSHV